MSKPPASNALTYVVVGLVGLGALVFMFLLFGELFILALVVFGLVGAFGGMHYLLWGRAMSNDAQKKQAKAVSSTTDPE